MECINHPGTAAAGTCRICGKGLCASCVSRFTPPACESCLLEHNAGVARRLYRDLALTVAIFAAVVAFLAWLSPQTPLAWFMVGLMLACAYWGWQFLNTIPIPEFFTSVGVFVGILICFKLPLSILVGFLAAPWEIYKRIKELRIIRELKKDIEAGEV